MRPKHIFLNALLIFGLLPAMLAQGSPPASPLWFSYQKAVAGSKGDSFDLPLPGIVVREYYNIILADGVLSKLESASLKKPVKKEGDTLLIYAERQRGIIRDVFVVCEFRVFPYPGGSILSVKIPDKTISPIDLSRDIVALVVDGRKYPLNVRYIPDDELPELQFDDDLPELHFDDLGVQVSSPGFSMAMLAAGPLLVPFLPAESKAQWGFLLNVGSILMLIAAIAFPIGWSIRHSNNRSTTKKRNRA